MTVNENGLSVTLTEKNGDRHLKAVSPDGKLLFDGPVNTDDQEAKIPPEVKRLYDNMQGGGGGFQFRFNGPRQPPAPRKPRGIII